MAEKGIKEILEILDAVDSLTVDAIVALKDGLSFDDIGVVTGNLTKIKDAVDGVTEVGAELKDLDFSEVKVLVNRALDMVENILAAIKPEEPAAPTE